MATKKQVHKIAGRVVEFQEKFFEARNTTAQFFIEKTNEAIEISIAAVEAHLRQQQKIERVLSDVISANSISATDQEFVVKDNFVVDTGKNTEVKISSIDQDFIDWFMEKREKAFSGSILCGRKLNHTSVDRSIIAQLGEQAKAETTLYEVFAMMKLQANGREGDLSINGYNNIFYVPDITGTLRTVILFWTVVGWRVQARSITFPFGWNAGVQVFSRNSLVT